MQDSFASDAAFAELSRNIESALNIVLSRPDNEWAADFVFNIANDPAGDVSMLTSPLPLANALVASVRSDPQVLNPSSTADVDYVMIPAWSIGAVTVGLSVARIANYSGTSSGEPVMSYNIGRFVRDERSAETLIVNTSMLDSDSRMSIPGLERPGCAIVYLRHNSSTDRYHFFAACNHELFFRGKHAESVIFSESVHQYRLCPVCSASPYMSCNCSIPLKLPKTALDFSAFIHNGMTHMGKFAGNSVFTCRDRRNGIVKRIVSISRDSFDGAVDNALSMELQNLAIQDRLRRANLCRTVMPGGCADPTSTDPITFNAVEITDNSVEITDGDQAPDPFDSELNIDVASLPALFDGPDISNDVNKLSSSNSSDILDPIDALIVDPAAVLQPQDEHSDSCPEPSTTSTSNTNGNESSSLAVASDIANTCENKAPQSSAGISDDEGSSFTVGDARSTKALERQRKNRLAAARSNARRKLHLDTLKADLEKGHDTVRILEAQRQELLSVNRELKEKAAGLWRQQARAHQHVDDGLSGHSVP